MAEEDRVLTKMEYHTYKIVKVDNDSKKIQIQNNEAEISKMKNEIIEIQLKKQELGKELVSQAQQLNNLEQEIIIIKSKTDSEIYKLQNELSEFQQRYFKQEENNEIIFSQYEQRQPNLYFCDIKKGSDDFTFLKIVFHQDFKIEKFDTQIQDNQVDIVVNLQRNEVAHIIKHLVQIDQQNIQCLAKVVQANEITFQFGQAS
ncbi:unnamed protein product [Paramecium pentaurelia]|uniref:Uncharacterized protein n=1 Tax=Paramecium pentaurelia TaxID=43138 RepID=A0A8S1TSV5_9CILI|nr:unnamed protein product [Paramecium pentaurelia]